MSSPRIRQAVARFVAGAGSQTYPLWERVHGG